MNFPTAAGEVETHKFQLSIVYHLLLFSVGVRRLTRSRFLASAMLSKGSTRTELGKRPIPTRRVGHNLNTITYRRSLLSRQPNSYHRGNRKDKREDNLVSHSLLLFCHSGNNQVTSSPGRDRHRTTRPGPRCVPLSFFFTTPLLTQRVDAFWLWLSEPVERLNFEVHVKTRSLALERSIEQQGRVIDEWPWGSGSFAFAGQTDKIFFRNRPCAM